MAAGETHVEQDTIGFRAWWTAPDRKSGVVVFAPTQDLARRELLAAVLRIDERKPSNG